MVEAGHTLGDAADTPSQKGPGSLAIGLPQPHLRAPERSGVRDRRAGIRGRSMCISAGAGVRGAKVKRIGLEVRTRPARPALGRIVRIDSGSINPSATAWLEVSPRSRIEHVANPKIHRAGPSRSAGVRSLGHERSGLAATSMADDIVHRGGPRHRTAHQPRSRHRAAVRRSGSFGNQDRS